MNQENQHCIVDPIAKQNSSPSILHAWNTISGEAIANTRAGPTVAARAISMMFEAAYNAWACYSAEPAFTIPSMRKRPREEWRNDDKSIAVSHAMWVVLKDIFSSQAELFDETLRITLPRSTESQSERGGAETIGMEAGRALLRARYDDGSNQLNNYSDYTGYVPINTPAMVVDPARWQPLRVPDGKGGFNVQTYLTPHWGLVRPFALKNGSELRPSMDHLLPSREELEEMVSLCANLTEEHKAIAEYWAGGPGTVTPPGMWAAIAARVSLHDHFSLDDDVKLFFMVGQAALDASIAAWDAKRAYDSVRPWTAVRLAYAGTLIRSWGGPELGTQLMHGEDWVPYQPLTFPTPPFPDFVSGHSAFSSAMAEVLKGIRGDALEMRVNLRAGFSETEPNAPSQTVVLQWSSLSEAADSAAMSRRYGGIHFIQGDLKGRELGRQVGQRVLAKSRALFAGHCPP